MRDFNSLKVRQVEDEAPKPGKVGLNVRRFRIVVPLPRTTSMNGHVFDPPRALWITRVEIEQSVTPFDACDGAVVDDDPIIHERSGKGV